MTLVGTGMHGDAMGSRGDALFCNADDVRNPVVPGIAEKGDFVDVDAETGHHF
jgi:hypothetical protein